MNFLKNEYVNYCTDRLCIIIKPLLICFALLIFSAELASAKLSKRDRDELYQKVDHMCRDASAVGQVLTYEGSLEAGATLKVVGVDAKGKITKEQWKNIEQKYGEFRTNPTVCNFEMIKLLQPLFGNYECRSKEYGLERFQREFDHEQRSGWMGGGFDRGKWCTQVIGVLRGQHPDGEFSVVGASERSESKCRPLNCPQYMYYCKVHVKTDPLYKENPDGC